MQKTFGHLALSHRPYFVPRGFWMSFKDYDGEPTNVREHQDGYEFFTRLQVASLCLGLKHGLSCCEGDVETFRLARAFAVSFVYYTHGSDAVFASQLLVLLPVGPHVATKRKLQRKAVLQI